MGQARPTRRVYVFLDSEFPAACPNAPRRESGVAYCVTGIGGP